MFRWVSDNDKRALSGNFSKKSKTQYPLPCGWGKCRRRIVFQIDFHIVYASDLCNLFLIACPGNKDINIGTFALRTVGIAPKQEHDPIDISIYFIQDIRNVGVLFQETDFFKCSARIKYWMAISPFLIQKILVLPRWEDTSTCFSSSRERIVGVPWLIGR
jgi:hypothetical protein